MGTKSPVLLPRKGRAKRAGQRSEPLSGSAHGGSFDRAAKGGQTALEGRSTVTSRRDGDGAEAAFGLGDRHVVAGGNSEADLP